MTSYALSSSSISISMYPENPAPYESVNISLSSYATDLDGASITFIVNGKTGLAGVGEKNFTLTVGAAGSETKVLIKIISQGEGIELNLVIRPSAMVLLWQAMDSYVPPFYKGKAMATADSDIKIVALPEIRNGGALVSPKNMTYSWKFNYDNDQGASGYGKNSYTYNNDYLENTNNVSVVATTIDQKYSATGNLDVGSANPKIVFYKRDLALGTQWQNALGGNHTITGNEILVAEPYFLSPKILWHPSLIWSWAINDSLVETPSIFKNIMPVAPQAGKSGTAKIRLDIENKDKIYETISKAINITF